MTPALIPRTIHAPFRRRLAWFLTHPRLILSWSGNRVTLMAEGKEITVKATPAIRRLIRSHA